MKFTNIKLKTIITGNNVIIIGAVKNTNKQFERINYQKTALFLNEKIYPIKFIKGIIISLFISKIPIEDLVDTKIHNKPYLLDLINNKKTSIRYSLYGKIGKYKNSKIKRIKQLKTSIYVRQNANNRLIITVRKINKTDELKEQIKINLACFISKFMPKKIILMYEKEAERYEESASIVYEKIVDRGIKDVCYLIDKDSVQFKQIPLQYKKNVIYKYTMKHYITFFCAKTLIGTESPGHAIELRVANKHAARRIYGNKFCYVFLQHGVMYMVSLDSSGRNFFRKNGGMPKNAKVVVSSQKEAEHFITLAGFSENDLYITGLPKYDKNKLNVNADKIIIMLTWRPWEYNVLRNNIENSRYYKLLEKIISAIPENLKDRIILMPHPLILNDIQKTELSKYILKEFSYNNVLENTKVLITDYSSIAYDAFYRGSNVIFYWEEKDYCMDMYKGNLMLNEDNVFGDICYDTKHLTNIIEKNYNNNQEKLYINNYKQIVEFNDNKNTQRLLNCLKNDNII